jgi:protein SCO1
MLVKILSCTFLLQLALLTSAVAQSSISVDSSAAPGFDYDAALSQSQAAIGQQVGEQIFTSADGHTLALSDFRGKPMVLSMVYTSCYQICPMTIQYLSQVVDKARTVLGEDSFEIAVIGFDAQVDTPVAMRYFASQQGISGRGWNLLTLSANDVERLAADIGFQYTPSANGFDHLIQTTIIDAEGRVYRQVYGQVFDTPLLVDPLIELVLGRSPADQPLLDNLISKIKLFCTTYDPARDGYYFDYSLFIGMFIGGSIILFTAVAALRSWRKQAS